jgi:anti-anti-sigma factor
VTLSGDIDLDNADSRADLLCGIVDLGEASALVVDCSGVHVLGSQGSAMMLRVHRHAAARGVRVVWANLSPLQRRVLELTDLARELHLAARVSGSREIPRR